MLLALHSLVLVLSGVAVEGFRAVNPSSEHADVVTDAVLDGGHALTSNASLLESEVSSFRRRRRRRCHQYPVKRNRYAGDKAPAQHYMIAHSVERTQLESFKSPSDVKWDSWWKSYITRIEIDWQGRELRRQCSCSTCDSYFDWAKRKLYTVTRCSSPSGRWKQVFAHYNARVDHTYSYSVWEGLEYSRTNSKSQEYGVEAGVAKGPFSASASYNHIVAVQETDIWSNGWEKTHEMFLPSGETAVVWQYELVAKCFNEVNMFMEELAWGTNIFHGTEGAMPTCDPNKNGDCR